MLGWSGRGCHVEFKRRDHIPLATHEVLGAGGYAVVQKVICESNDRRPLAQKIIRDYRNGLEDIMGEVKHIQQLRHRHLIQLVGTYALGWSLHILLFPVGQWNLKAFLEEFQDSMVIEKAYSEFYSLGMFFKCLSCAVAYLHTEVTPHIKHLDIKPENIIIRQYARHRLTVFLTDFGVSRSFKPSATSQDIHTLYTSPIYMAPEVVKHAPFGRPADIFSLGCVFSEMASVLGGKSLLEYKDHRRLVNDNGITTISFESNLLACKSWLKELRSNAPFRQLSIGRSEWWTRLLTLIEEMLSAAAGARPDSSEVLARFPPGPCCTISLEEYYPTSTPSPGHTSVPQVNSSPKVVTDNASDLTIQGNAQESAAVSQVYLLAPKNEPSISLIVDESRRADTATAVDWSGKGAHVEYLGRENAPLEEIEVIGLGSFSLVTKVRTTKVGPYVLVKKSLEKGNHLLRLEMLLQEVKVLQNLEHPHIVRLVGTLSERRFFSLLMYPAADCNLHAFMQIITSESEGTKTTGLNIRKNSLHKFMKCLIHGLGYLHSERIRHKDIKPSNILVQRRRNLEEYHVYLAGRSLPQFSC
jgi:serine/threonine protein kinase